MFGKFSLSKKKRDKKKSKVKWMELNQKLEY